MKFILTIISFFILLEANAQETNEYQNRSKGLYLSSKSITINYNDGRELRTSEYIASVLFNFGQFEIGPGVGATTSQSGVTFENTLILGVSAQFNFIPNIPGNAFIPYIGATYSKLTATSDSATGTGSINSINLGLKYFPFGGNNATIFGGIGQSNSTLVIDGLATNAKSTAITMGIGLYF